MTRLLSTLLEILGAFLLPWVWLICPALALAGIVGGFVMAVRAG